MFVIPLHTWSPLVYVFIFALSDELGRYPKMDNLFGLCSSTRHDTIVWCHDHSMVDLIPQQKDGEEAQFH